MSQEAGGPDVTGSDVLTVVEAAGLLKTSRSTLYRLVDRGEIGGWFYLGEELRFSREALVRWISCQASGSQLARRPRRARKGKAR